MLYALDPVKSLLVFAAMCEGQQKKVVCNQSYMASLDDLYSIRTPGCKFFLATFSWLVRLLSVFDCFKGQTS